MTYVFTYRRNWFWHSFKVSGHTYDATQDKIVLFFPDGGVREITKWRECEVRLCADWVLAQQKALEAQTGTPIALAVGGK